MLVVGPSEAFLEYIAAVLPTLGELDVAQVTVDDLLDHVPVRAEDPPDVAALKHDGRMVEVVRRALDSHVREATDPLVVPDGTARHRVPVQALNRLVADARNAVTEEQLPYRLGRERLRARVVALLQRMAEARGEYPGETWRRRVSTCRPVTALLDAVWPDVRPDLLIAKLFSDPDLLATASDGVLTDDERAVLVWRRRHRPASAPWTLADRVLIDEALGLIERLPSYGHVIIDEAQDLSVMQCRAVARRSRHGSLTALGDLAQGTAPWATRRWQESLTHLGRPDASVAELTTGFRVPEAVLTMANRLLPSLNVDVPQALSLRRDGTVRVHATDDLTAAVAGVVSEALAHEGSIGVIAADATMTVLRDALKGLPERVTLLPASLAKGLEYDHVVVVEPAEIVAAEPRGTHRLYVVLTRAVSRLDVVHVRPLPEPLAA